MPRPDPLSDGHIEGQNAATPERLPRSTSNVVSEPGGNEEELGGRPAFLFRSDVMAVVTLDSSGAYLPAHVPPWTLERYFTLGVLDEGCLALNNRKDVTSFMGLCDKLRQWDRELKVDIDS